MNILWIFYLFIIIFYWKFLSVFVTSTPTITGPDFVDENWSIFLNCVATCTNSTPCAYSWTGYSLSAPLPAITLQLERVNRTFNDKEYTCTVTDPVDGTKREAKKSVHVYYGPDSVTIGDRSRALTVVEGDLSDTKEESLKCIAECNPPCNFTWTLSGKTVSTTQKLFSTNKMILRGDKGNYTCAASALKTGSKSEWIDITVNYAPTVTLTWNKDKNTLICGGIGIPTTYHFKKIEQSINDIIVQSHDVIPSGNTATLNLGPKDYQDTGKYKCSVNNGVKNYITGTLDQSKTTHIDVEDLPILVNSQASYNVSKGSPLNITITLYSYPEANETYTDLVAMTSDFRPLKVEVEFHETSVRTNGQELYLNLNKVLEEHFTMHTIYIGNTVGNISTNLTIFPEGPPDIPTSFSKSDITPESVTFTVVTGFYNGAGQTVVVEHRLEGNQSEWSNKTLIYAGVEKDRAVNLAVTDLTPETVYEFRAYAFNEYSRSGYTEVIKEKTNEAPLSAGAVVGIVLGSVAFLIIVGALVVVLFMRCRRKDKDIDDGTYTEQNKDLTVEMETPHLYVNNRQQNAYTEEPPSPDQPSNIYENTKVTMGLDGANNAGFYDVPPSHEQMDTSRYSPHESHANKTEPYDNPRPNAGPHGSTRYKKDLYDSPRSKADQYDSPRSKKDQYDSPRSKKDLYVIPRSNKDLYDTPRSEQELYDRPRSNKDLYDSPRSQATYTGGYRNDKKENGETIPPYLDLNNPDAVDEAYLGADQSKLLVQQSSANSRLSEGEYLDLSQTNMLIQQRTSKSSLKKQEAVLEEEYLDMNVVKEVQNRSKEKESPYVNAQKSNKRSKEKEVNSGLDGKGNKNIVTYKKNKDQSTKEEKPYQNMKKDTNSSKIEDNEEVKDYQNLTRYKKVPQQPSVESNSELYMDMSADSTRQSAVSLPEYHAPPPPLHEEDYMNIRIGKHK